jgi:alkylation response protein AidB-like acyl-CoA dehydrogenase
MDFEFTPEQIAFRQEVTQFILENLPVNWEVLQNELENPEASRIVRDFYKKLAEKGWLSWGLPTRYGGKEADLLTQMIFEEVSSYFGVLSLDNAMRIVGPLLVAQGNEHQMHNWLGGIAKGQWLWSSMTIESGITSDVMSVRSRISKQEDEFVINGSRIIKKSDAATDFVMLITEIGNHSESSDGWNLFFVDMKSSGIEVNEGSSIYGTEWGLISFVNVRVPKENLIGEEGRGLAILGSYLRKERFPIRMAATAQSLLDTMVSAHQKITDMHTNLATQDLLAQMSADIEVLRMLAYGDVGEHTILLDWSTNIAIAKLFGDKVLQKVVLAAMDMVRVYPELKSDKEWESFRSQIIRNYWIVFSGGGPMGGSEVHRHIIAHRGLGLPTQ